MRAIQAQTSGSRFLILAKDGPPVARVGGGADLPGRNPAEHTQRILMASKKASCPPGSETRCTALPRKRQPQAEQEAVDLLPGQPHSHPAKIHLRLLSPIHRANSGDPFRVAEGCTAAARRYGSLACNVNPPKALPARTTGLS
jgi:hypothetical protein